MNKFFKILVLIFLSLSNFFYTIVLAEEKIKIGLLVPTTGDNKNLGQQIIKSTRIALKEIGSEKIEIYLKDTGFPALIKDPSDFDSIYVVMPMKG